MLLIADLGPLHASLPGYNAQTVLELMSSNGDRPIVHTGLSEQDWRSGHWREHENPLLFALQDQRLTVQAIAPDWSWADSEHKQMLELLKQYPQGRSRLQTLAKLQTELREWLSKPLDATNIYDERLLNAVAGHHKQMADLFEEGPGTAHRQQRLNHLRQILTTHIDPSSTVIVPMDDLPELLKIEGAKQPDLSAFKPGEASRFRAILDRAYRLEEHDDLEALVHLLLDLDGPVDSVLGRMALEARFVASGLYLAVGDTQSALDLLEAVARSQFDRPDYLPGFVLARLGQVRDLTGQRSAALRAYQAALGLNWLPSEAKQVAERGLEAPFELV